MKIPTERKCVMTTRLYEIERLPELGATRILLSPDIKALPSQQAMEKLKARLGHLYDELDREEAMFLKNNNQVPAAEAVDRIRELHLETEMVQQCLACLRDRCGPPEGTTRRFRTH